MPESLHRDDNILPEEYADHSSRGFSGHLKRLMRTAFAGLMRIAFHLLYYQLSSTYDAVAWIVSGGEWAEWRRSVIPFLLDGPVLELAHGTGTLALDMADRGFPVTAVDLSPAMGKIASRRIRSRRANLGKNPPPALLRADVRQLPLRKEAFSSAVSTFPADFIFSRKTIHEVHRTLRPGGRFVIVPSALPEWFAKRAFPLHAESSSMSFLKAVTQALESAGFAVRTEILRRPRSRVILILAEKK
jgi:ubiquinone/menaquinone biosynthesis C-methylase UbiE